jgi:hypothetical protein
MSGHHAALTIISPVSAAQEIHAAEEAIRVEIAAGRDLRSARTKVSYHDLQKRQEP